MRRLAVLLLALSTHPLAAQSFDQQGFFDTQALLYPQSAPGDSGNAVGEGLFRYEASYTSKSSFRIHAGFEARTDSHRQTERTWDFNYQDRGLQRPAFSIRRLSLLWYRGNWTVEAGKQFISWGKTDILNPTNRFTPRDFTNVAQTENLGVTAARATYTTGSDSFDFVWSPFLTPSRAPLLNQRWAVRPEQAAGIPLDDLGARYPGGSQFGFRWNHIGDGYEASLVLYEGSNYMPLFEATPLEGVPLVQVQRFYPNLRLIGADVVKPLPWFTLKAEAAYYASNTAQADEYGLYVIQLERLVGEWTFIGGYIGEMITRERDPFDFAPDRGLARSFVGRAGYTIGPRSSMSFEAAGREDLDGGYGKAEYSRLLSDAVRFTASYALFRGKPTDFFGQYRRNSHFMLKFRYSF